MERVSHPDTTKSEVAKFSKNKNPKTKKECPLKFNFR